MNVLTKDDNIIELISQNNFSDAAKLLFEKQTLDWPQLASGVETLQTVKEKSFLCNGFTIKAQFNAGRMISTSAKVDPKSIKERKCFLCQENLPSEQKGILYQNEYLILCNPFPIFPTHFTLTHKKHQPQRIVDTFFDLLSFSKDLSRYYSVIYNGPKCGASAPDHLHFQAGNKMFMPIDDDFHQLKNEFGIKIVDNEELSVFAIDDGMRKFISIESLDVNRVEKTFSKFYKTYSDLRNSEDEPLINLISFYEEEFGWRVIIFLREKHRSSHYFREDESKILVSPAAIDLGGVMIFPREEDFNRVDEKTIRDVLNEVFISSDQLKLLVKKLRDKLE